MIHYKDLNKTLTLFVLSLILVLIQWVIFDRIWTIIIIFIVIIWFKIYADKWYKNYIKDVKSFLLNDENFPNVMILFYFIFWVYAMNSMSQESIIITVVWYLVVAFLLLIYIDDKKQEETKQEKYSEYRENPFDDTADDNLSNTYINTINSRNFWNTPVKDLLSEDEWKDFEETMNEARENIDEMLELDEDKKDYLLDDMLDKVLSRQYDVIIEFNDGKLLQDYLIQTNNVEALSQYCLLVWASYQEVWNLVSADKYFDIFLSNISINENTTQAFEKQGISDTGVIKMMLLIKELQDLWLSYKVSKEDYDKSIKPSKKKNKKKAKK